MVTARDIAEWVGGFVTGDANLSVEGVALIDNAKKSDLTFVRKESDFSKIVDTKAHVILVPPVLVLPAGKTYIKVPCAPEKVLGLILERFQNSRVVTDGFIDPTVQIANTAVVESGVTIGANTVIQTNATIKQGVKIGENCVIYPNVVIYGNSRLSDRVIIHAGAVIGCDSFEFIDQKNTYEKLPNIGNVRIEDNVEIGANTTIDRGTIGSTIIKKGTKIDNLVQIGHEVEIGEHCIIAAQTGIAGWTKIGNHTTLYGQCGVVGDIEIGDRVIVMGKSVVTKHVESDQIVSGNPAMPHRDQLKFQAFLTRLFKKRQGG